MQRGGGSPHWSMERLLAQAGIVIGALCVSAVVLFFVYQGLCRSVFFQVERVQVTGCERTTAQQILAWTGLDVKTNLWAIRTGRIKRQLEEQDWIEHVEISRNWPNRLTIIIRERVAVALVSSKNGLSYVDKGGVAFAETMAGDDCDYPIITGLEGETATPERLQEAMQFLALAANGSVDLPKQNISEIHVMADGGLVLFMADNPFPIRLGSGEMKKKFSQLTRVLSWLYRKKQVADAAYIDVNYLAGIETDGKKRDRVLVRFVES